MCSRLFKICSFLFILISLSACGGPDQPKQSATPLSPRMIKLAESGDGVLTATAEMFDSEKKSLGRQDLIVDLQQGRAYSQDGDHRIKLKKGRTYTALVVFSYQVASTQLPIGFVVVTQFVSEDYVHFNWSSEDIILSKAEAQGNTNLSSSFVPEAMIPDLDTDGDGFSNFAEFLDKSDPSDPNSIPQGPELVSTLDPKKIYQDEIVFSVKFKDNSGVASVKALNPICGYSNFAVSSATAGDNSEVELKATFNLHASSATSPINLTLKSTDIWGASSEQTLTFQFSKNPNSPIHGPEIAIIKPSEGESISGEAFAEALACHEAEIINLEPTVGNLGDEDAKPESYQGKINSSALGDGPKTLTFKAVAKNPQDPNQTYTQERSVNVLVDNNNPIRVDSPAPGTTIRDVTNFIFSVDENKLPGVTELFVESVTANGEEEPIFASLKNGDDNSAPSVYKRSVDTTPISDEREITINLKAISPTQTVTRKVTYRVQNGPKISLKLLNSDGDFNPCLVPGTATLTWEVTNRGSEDPIYLNDVELKDGNGDWVASGTKEVDCSKLYTLNASRIGQNMQGENKKFVTEKLAPLTQATIEGVKNGEILPPVALHNFSFKINGISANTHWKVEWKKNNLPLNPISSEGQTINLGELEINANYEIIVYLLNKIGQPISKSSSIVFQASSGVVGWWKFDNENNFGLDSSGFNNHANTIDNLAGVDSCIFNGCASFDNAAHSQMFVPHSPSLELDSITIEMWINWQKTDLAWFKKDSWQFLLNAQEFRFTIVTEDNQVYNLKLPNIDLFALNKWYHVVGVFDSQNQSVALYIDGVMRASQNNTPGKLLKNGASILIGYDATAKIDEFIIYNRGLSQEEVKRNCNYGIPGHCP